MMEDTWLSIEDESNSSFADSDAIDSETEADLYSIIHYEQNLHNLKCPTAKIENAHTSDETKNIPLTVKSTEFNESNSVSTFNHESVFLSKEPQKLNLVKENNSGSSDKCNVSCSQNSEDIYVNQTVKDTLSNKKKRKSDYDVNSNSVKKNLTGLNDSSDSDSIIWTEVDSSDRKEFQTNLCEEEVIYLSSESESHFDYTPVSKKRKGNLRNMSMPNIKIGENIKDLLWYVNDEDLRRSKQNRSRRYHDNVENTCSNCLGKGHNYKICPLPKTIKCFICGGVGHPGSVCANRICGRCFSAGHDSKRCWRRSFRNCILCSMEGHVKENCPDLWRRYHLTTRPGKIVRGQKPTVTLGSFIYCSNCGQGGHNGAACTESRGPTYYLRTWPCVVSYADPENLLRERLNSNRERQNNMRRENHLNLINIPAGANVNPEEKNNNQEKCNNFKRENHLNQMNTAVGANFSSEKKKKKKNNLKQHWKQWRQFKKAQREKDFPRTPKNNQSNCSNDSTPEFQKKVLIKRQRRRERRRNRKLKKNSKLLAERNEGPINFSVPVASTGLNPPLQGINEQWFNGPIIFSMPVASTCLNPPLQGINEQWF